MKKEQSRLWLFLLLLVVPVSARAQQAWSGIISPSRAINWSNAGVIGGIPDASWAQCGSTIQAYGTSGAPGSASTINNAISACGTNQYVQLGAGTFYLNSSINFGGKSNVVLRGVGADQTIILFTSGPGSGCQGLGGGVCIINGDAQDARSGLPNTANWTAGYVPGTTSITLSSTANLSVGALLILWQADQPSDPGTIWNCQNTGSLGTCSQQGGQGGPSGNSQTQTVTVTSVSGNTVGISPGLYSPIWSAAYSPHAGWPTHLPVTNDGVENLTLDSTLATDSPVTGGTLIFFGWATNCWATGVRTINNASPPYRNNIWTYQSSHLTIQNNYIYGSNGYDLSYGIELAFMTDDSLVANNMLQHTATAEIINTGTGNVFAYNFSVDNYYTANGSAPGWQQSDSYPSHQDGSYLNLFEGNVGAKMAADDIHGSSWMATAFRNYWTGRDGPFKTGSTMAVDIEAYARYFNMIGNVLGEPGYHNSYKDMPASQTDNTGCGTTGNRSIFALGWAGGQGCSFSTIFNDTKVAPTIYLWGNYDTVTAAVRWCGNSSNAVWSTICSLISEVPTALSAYAQAVPSSTALPASFYFVSAPWWYVDGLGHTTIPYPAIGPDVIGSGPGGFVNAIPAQVCFNNTSYDTRYAMSPSISSITENGTTATATLAGAAPAGFSQYQSFWIRGSSVAGYNRLWQISSVSGSTITFTAYAGLGSASGGTATVNAIHSFNAAACYGQQLNSGQPFPPTSLSLTIH
jgi:hypothetical protein